MTHKRYVKFVLVAAALAPSCAIAAANPDLAVGRWRTPARHGVVELTRCGASLCGRLVDSDNMRTNPNLRDANNKDAAKRSRKLKDLQILSGFTRKASGWEGGAIYNPEDGGTYKATITPTDANTLKLKGCIVWPLCKTQTWTRLR